MTHIEYLCSRIMEGDDKLGITGKLWLGSFLAEGIPFVACWAIFGWWEGFVFGIFLGKFVNRYVYFPLATGKTFFAYIDLIEEE